jgi:hypothetical protein
MQVTEAIEGVKVYNLSAGKSLKQWLEEASTRHVSLKKSVRRSFEFIVFLLNILLYI